MPVVSPLTISLQGEDLNITLPVDRSPETPPVGTPNFNRGNVMAEFASVGPRVHLVPPYANVETGTAGRPHVSLCYSIFIPSEEDPSNLPKCHECHLVNVMMLESEAETIFTKINAQWRELQEWSNRNGNRTEVSYPEDE